MGKLHVYVAYVVMETDLVRNVRFRKIEYPEVSRDNTKKLINITLF